jgi:hypothetical protein
MDLALFFPGILRDGLICSLKSKTMPDRSGAMPVFKKNLLRLLRSVALCCDWKNAFSPRLTSEVARLRSQL